VGGDILVYVDNETEKKNTKNTENNTESRISEIEVAMGQGDFWANKEEAQAMIKELQELKDKLAGAGKYDKGNAILAIYAGAGGDDAEDFAHMLFEMYRKFVEKKGWSYTFLHEHANDHGGYRNITMEVEGKMAYGTLKNEYGVHRLVRISPFNAAKKRHTSFALVEILPVIEKAGSVVVPEDDLDISFARSSGPGGQNVNKRETAVRIVHKPTGVSVRVEGERSQERNREKALSILTAKLERLLEQEHKEELKELSTDPGKIEWGSQIRSYVLHPYQMVKDHRTGVEVRDAHKVLEEGDIDAFLLSGLEGNLKVKKNS
jgi:peptide chain release factor 2